MFKQFSRVDTLVLWVAIGKELTDVAKSQSPKKCITYRVYSYIAIGVCHAALSVLYLYAT